MFEKSPGGGAGALLAAAEDLGELVAAFNMSIVRPFRAERLM
jgi:hypothetical protein